MSTPDAPAKRRPLVLVTRPAGTADPLVGLLEGRGYRVAAVPTVVTRPAAPGGALDAAIADRGGWDWIVVTSGAGAQAVAQAMAASNELTPAPLTTRSTRRIPRWAAVGPTTAGELAAAGIVVDFVPRAATGAGIARELVARWDVHGARVLLARADAASDDLPTALRSAGAEVHDVVAYHTIEAPAESGPGLADALSSEDLLAIVVASGSAVRGLLRLVSDAGLQERALATPVVSIGPSTTAVARGLGVARLVQADRPSTEGLLAAVDAAAEMERAQPVIATPPRSVR